MGAQINASPVITLPCSVALEPFRRVKRDATNGLAYAGPLDADLGVLDQRQIVSGLGARTQAAVLVRNATGTQKMVAAGAISEGAYFYGAANGKISGTPNANPLGVTMEAATADGDIIEVMRFEAQDAAGGGDEVGGLEFFDDFLGGLPAAATAINRVWTKGETDGLGVTASDEANGVAKFAFDAVAEVGLASLYMTAKPFDIDQKPIFEARCAVFDIGDDAALDINFGLANGTHGTDFDSVTAYIAFHLDGASLVLKAQATDGTHTLAATTTGVTLTDDGWFTVKIDATDKSDVRLYVNGTRVLASTTIDMSSFSGTLTPIFHMEKASDNTTADFRVDYCRVRSERA